MNSQHKFHEEKCSPFKALTFHVNTDSFLYCPYCSVQLNTEKIQFLEELKIKIEAMSGGKRFQEHVQNNEKIKLVKLIYSELQCTLAEAKHVMDDNWNEWRRKYCSVKAEQQNDCPLITPPIYCSDCTVDTNCSYKDRSRKED